VERALVEVEQSMVPQIQRRLSFDAIVVL